MKFDCVVDSYAWVEYFRGSVRGAKVRDYIESRTVATSAITIAELQEKYLREKWRHFTEDLSFMMARTTLVPVDRNISLAAGQINYSRKKVQKDWGMADSIVLATARELSAGVLTGDPHFKDLPEAVLI
jgi:predicted nucleic acid-binding protein